MELVNELRAGQAQTALVLAVASIGAGLLALLWVTAWGPMPETNPACIGAQLFLVGGCVPGALLRWQVALHLGDQNLLVNVLGLPLGLLAGLPAAPRRQLLLGIGFCGSLTTFSSWMLAATKHLSSGDWPAALGLIGLTLGLGLGAAALGFSLGRRVVRQ